MSTEDKQLLVEQPDELLKFLLKAIPNKGRNAVKSILARGQVSVNNKTTTRYDHPLQKNDQVTISWSSKKNEIDFIGLQILYEDEDLIAIHKEAGLLSIAGKQAGEPTAHYQLSQYVKQHNPKARIFVVHRLDRDTSGVMVFAKHERAKQTLQNHWHDAKHERIYIGLVEKQVKKAEGTIESWLKESKTLHMYSSPAPNGGQHAITHYKVLQASADYSLLELRLETGRKNQIRVHMQDLGHPIVGDKKYGSTINPLGRLGLHAKSLVLSHPASGQLMHFEAPVPKAFTRYFVP